MEKVTIVLISIVSIVIGASISRVKIFWVAVLGWLIWLVAAFVLIKTLFL